MSEASLRYDAREAVRQVAQRERRVKDTYDRILHRCLKQVSETANACKRSTMFRLPQTCGADCTPLNAKLLMDYLIVALRDDRGFIVVPWDAHRLYVRWESNEDVRRLQDKSGALSANFPSALPRERGLVDKDVGVPVPVPAAASATVARPASQHMADVQALLRSVR